MLSRRSAILSLATLAAPVIIRTPGVLMPIRMLRPDDSWSAVRQWAVSPTPFYFDTPLGIPILRNGSGWIDLGYTNVPYF